MTFKFKFTVAIEQHCELELAVKSMARTKGNVKMRPSEIHAHFKIQK